MALNTTDFVAGQPSTLSIDGLITEGGNSYAIACACQTIRFDPAKVAISNLHTQEDSGWIVMAYNTDHTAEGWMKVVVYNGLVPGQTTNGPMLLFTVTPADASVDVNDCDTLRLSADESDLCDDGSYDYQPTDACGGTARSQGSGASGGTEPSTYTASTGCTPTADAVVQTKTILRIAAGLAAGTAGDIRAYDQNDDLQITIEDAVLYLRNFCSAEPEGWYTFQGNRRRTGRSLYDVSPTPSKQWKQALGLAYNAAALPNLPASPIVVPNPGTGASTVFAVASNGTNSLVLRVNDDGNTTPTITGTATFNNVVLTGTPLYSNNKVFLTGNDATGGHLYSINAWDSGPTLSSTTLYGFGGNVYSSPIIDPVSGGVLVSANTTGDTAGRLFCIEPGNGSKLWDTTLGAPTTYSSPSVTLTSVYVGDGAGYINGYNLSTQSRVLHSQPAYSYRVDATPSINGNALVCGTRNPSNPNFGTILMYTANADGSAQLQTNLFQDPLVGYFRNVWGSPAYQVESHTAVFTDDAARTVGINTRYPAFGGTENWSPDQGTIRYRDTRYSIVVAGAPHAATTYSFLGEDSGYVQVRAAADGTYIGFFGDGSAPLDGAIRSSFAAYKGRLYVQTTAGGLYCFQ